MSPCYSFHTQRRWCWAFVLCGDDFNCHRAVGWGVGGGSTFACARHWFRSFRVMVVLGALVLGWGALNHYRAEGGRGCYAVACVRDWFDSFRVVFGLGLLFWVEAGFIVTGPRGARWFDCHVCVSLVH